MSYLEDARAFFKADYFATETTGITIDEVELGYAKCSLTIAQKHMNAGNMVMGGAIFTLADFAFGIAANAGQPMTITLNSTISYLGVAKGKRLLAEARVIKAGRSTCVVTVEVSDELGTPVAIATMTGFRKS
ncbi:MAG: PaaI family thioesterase [Angelakisella sp.]